MDALTGRYRLPCPRSGEVAVRLSSFRHIARLEGAAHPAAYRILFDCTCGDEHVALVTEPELDWEPLGLDCSDTFVNLMTSRRDGIADDLRALALQRIGAGEWPWSFFCYLEDRSRPATPSAFVGVVDAAQTRARRLGLAVRCPACSSISINVVSEHHVDLPFWNDERVGVVEHVFAPDGELTLDAFRAELHSSAFDERRLELA